MKLKLLIALTLLFISSASAATPDNITLELRFDAEQVYSDGEEKTSEFTEENFRYPYIVSNQPTGIVSYSEALEISYESISASEDKFELTQTGGTFLLPHTTGGYQTIEEQEDEVRNRELLNIINPSFGFPTPTSRSVKISYHFPYTVTSFEGRDQNLNQLTVRNKLNGENEIELGLRGS